VFKTLFDNRTGELRNGVRTGRSYHLARSWEG
jgi:hypothetical protein